MTAELRLPNCASGVRSPFHSLRSLKRTNLQKLCCEPHKNTEERKRGHSSFRGSTLYKLNEEMYGLDDKSMLLIL
jgi:hypothetical protein